MDSLPIQVNGLTRFYGKTRGVDDLAFTVERGEIFGFLGPNGAGKTTTIRLLMGLIQPTRGSARIFGLDCWRDATAVKSHVGYVPGDARLYEAMTGAQFLDFLAGFRPGIDPARRRMLVERFDVDLSRTIKHLSKGNRQKLALVQAFMHDPPLLILDEPSSGLDPLMQRELLTFLREEQARGKTIFLSSHLLYEVEQVADRVGIIRDGRLVAVATIEELKRQRTRRMEVAFSMPIDLAQLASVDGVQVLQVREGGRWVELGVSDGLPVLLRRLSELPVVDLVYAPPDLDSVFMGYYQRQEAITGERAR
ncbi:ABC transporter ATP-binding protein [Thermomicrobiaceae bacterium CFH 74404]|uniref:ABC transporter ATP-binding protein n=1 Tax=Thermalbibacter longus TaxID=2951981 RepID=A0AA41WAS7_9BACT|nr:ABC transporter ATP-binding protein [Thermalbibacter longus]MCM8749434.1 ABC transporter ATP-binding protein [Thermalbibacter longus]